MKIHKALLSALGTAALPLGLHFASGRAGALFYAQMDRAAWLGILISGGSFALMLRFIACHPRRQWGRWAIRSLAALRIFLAWMLLREAAHIGSLALPVHHAGICAAAFALLLCFAAALSGRSCVLKLSAGYGLLLAAFLIGLQFAPDEQPSMNLAVELRLGNRIPAAVLLGLCHSALCASMAEPVYAPVRGQAALSGLIYSLLLALSNAVFLGRNPALMRLKAPFAALASGWGTGGFYLSTLVIFLGCVSALSGIVYGFFAGSVSERKCLNSGKNRC